MQTRLKIAIQKSGILYDDSLKLLKDCGIDLKNGINKLKTEADNFPMEVFFLRDDDIPQYVEDAVADIGIVGENVIYEKNKKYLYRKNSDSANAGCLSLLEEMNRIRIVNIYRIRKLQPLTRYWSINF